jgi:hypothetical protein
LHDLNISELVESSQGGYDVTLGYPITGSDLLGRLASIDDIHVIVHEGDQAYSNRPLTKEADIAPAVEAVASAEPLAKPAKVFELRTVNQEQMAEMMAGMKTSITESLAQELSALRQELSNRTPESVPGVDLSGIESRLDILGEALTALDSRLDAVVSQMEQNNNLVRESTERYQEQLTEMALSSNRANQKVRKEVKRDSNGFITEVIESIITSET